MKQLLLQDNGPLGNEQHVQMSSLLETYDIISFI
jgi:hypothetical protein